jgi:hypothetical protein
MHPGLRPAIPDEEFLPSLQKYCFSERMVQIFQQEPGFGELSYRSHQICFVMDFTRETVDQKLSVNQLARAFSCHTACIKGTLANGFGDPKSRDRHLAFDDDSEGEILTWIDARAEKCRSMTRTDLRHYFQTK